MTTLEKITLAVELLKPLRMTPVQIDKALQLLKDKNTPQSVAGRKVGASTGRQKAKKDALRKLYEINPSKQ